MKINEAREQFKNGLSEEQIQFLDVMDNNVLVSASAGSGKTYTLIKKLVDLIVYYHISIENLLVVTFTNSAGEELRNKLYSELLKEINTNTNKEIDKEALYAQLEKIKVADIGTLHSVCYKYVIQYFYKCAINPTSIILSDNDTKVMIDYAIERAIEEYLEIDDEEFYNVYDSFSKSRNSGELKNILKNIYYFVQSLPSKNEWLKSTNYNENNKDLNTNVFANYILNHTKNLFDEYENIFKSMQIESEALGLIKHSVALQSILNDINMFKKCESFEEASKIVFNQFKFLDTKYIWKKEPTDRVEFNERYLKIKDSFNKLALSKLKSYFVGEDTKQLLELEEKVNFQIVKLFEIVEKVNTYYKEYKEENLGLDYNDLEQKMLEILEDKEVKNQLQNNFEFIFVDEYQDINAVQEKILLQLSHKNNMYMIGDVKQSIYGFRMSTPDIFIEKYSSYKNNKLLGNKIDLNKNYRSVDNILQFVNYIFSVIGFNNTMGVNYLEQAMLNCGINRDKNESENSVEINILQPESKNEIITDPIEDNETSDEDDNEIGDSKDELQEKREANFVCEKVKYYLNQRYYDYKTNKLKPIKYNDIAILIRDKSRLLEKIYAELLMNNIPVSTELKIDLFKKYEVNMLTNLLKIVNNLNDDIALVSVLLSPIGKLSNEDLAIIKDKTSIALNDKSKNQNMYFVSYVMNYMENFDNEITNKIKQVFNLVESLNNMQNNFTLSELVHYVIIKYDLYYYFSSFVDGGEKTNNIKQFIKILDNNNYKNNLVRFLDYLKIMEQDNQSYLIQNGANCVNIVTMHKSKGLDYPVVIAVELGKSFSREGTKRDLILTNQLGMGLKYNDVERKIKYKTLSGQANTLKKWIDERKEQIRLFYVAITRPKNYLCLVGTYDIEKANKVTYKNVLDCNSFMELLLYGMIKNNISMSLPKKDQNVIKIKNELYYNFNIINANDKKEQDYDNNTIIENVKMINNFSNELNRQFDFIYPRVIKVAVKNTVTSLLEENDYENFDDEPSAFTLKENVELKNNDALLLGVAYHSVLEQVDYNNENDIKNILENLKNTNQISNEISEKIDVSKIEKTIYDVKNFITPSTTILKEKQFMLRDSYKKLVGSDIDTNVLVQGIVDLILIENSEATIIDFKTNRTTNEKELIEKYKLQLKLYAHAVEEGYGVKIKNKFLYSVYLNKFINLG